MTTTEKPLNIEEPTQYDADETPMHWALLYGYEPSSRYPCTIIFATLKPSTRGHQWQINHL